MPSPAFPEVETIKRKFARPHFHIMTEWPRAAQAPRPKKAVVTQLDTPAFTRTLNHDCYCTALCVSGAGYAGLSH